MKNQSHYSILFVLLMLFGISGLFAQQLPPVQFEFGPRHLPLNVNAQSTAADVLAGAVFNENHYMWVQFDGIPTDEWRSELERNGIEFIEYIPRHCYLLGVPMNADISSLYQKGVRSMQVMDLPTKIDMRIMSGNIPKYAFEGSGIRLKVMTMPHVNLDAMQSELIKAGGKNLERPHHDRFIFITASESNSKTIAMLPWVRYVELMDPVGEPESVEGRSMQRGNMIDNHLSSGGLSYDGDGIKVLVRDDGDVGPHIDFQGRLWNDPSNSSSGTHGDGVAGCWAAGGNLDPTVVASASAADVYVIDYLSTFLDNTLTLHQDSGVLLTNSSYSNGCNAGYTTTTETVDQMAYDNPSLLHMFSAGNSNNNDCGYGAGDQWGNITGGHKQGKNVIAVANLGRTVNLQSSSSRGPAHDGRIKPDLAGHGAGQISTDPNNAYQSFGGTSAASPSTAGNLAQLYHVYQDLTGNTAPSALMKACALNSAQDLGNVGPDFKYGWGLIHAGRAYEILANNQYLTGSVSNGGSNTHNISVPSGVGQLRIMVYWADQAASASASVALINDIDMTVTDPGSTTHLPYLLDHTPNATTLDLPAGNGADHLNNVEQVAITSPAAGTYTVNVSGFDIPSGPHPYYVVYSFIPTGVKVTYPLGGEKLVDGNLERVHWDAFGNTGTFNVEYSTNNGSSWNTIASAVAADERSVDWTLPTGVTSANCLVRVQRGGESDQSDEAFHIHPVPSNLVATPVSLDSVELTWNTVAGAANYNVYMLGNEKMDLIATTSSTNFIVAGLSTLPTYWFSVSANTPPALGQRAVAIDYQHPLGAGCVGCPMSETLPFMEGFEAGLGDFCNPTSDDFDWTTNSGTTASSGTGPSSAFEGTTYIYTEASSPNFPSREVNLVSPCINLTTCTNAYLKFHYHMFGVAMGSLKVQISLDQGITWGSPIFDVNGNQGDVWREAALDLTSYCGSNMSFRFAGTTGSDFTSDIAVDNIIIEEGTICFAPQNLTTSSVGNTDAEILWRSVISAGSYEIELVDITASEVFSGIPDISGVTDTTYMFTALTEFNQYQAYVRSSCGADSSSWTGPLNFTTGCDTYPGNTLSDAIDILSFPYADTNSTDNICVTNEYSGQSSPELFYKLTTGSGADSLLIRTCNQVSDFDTYLYLLDAGGNALALNDDAPAGTCSFTLNGLNRFSVLNVDVDPLTTYYIVVDGWSTSSLGNFALLVEEVSDCVAAMTINGTPVSGTYSSSGVIMSDAFIQNPNVVRFSASGGVDLLNNFEVESGAVFTADTVGCN